MLRFRILITILGLPLLLPGEGNAQTAREKLINIAKNFTGDAGQILQRVGDFDFEKFLNRKDTAGLLEGFGTVIHESCHHLNHLISMNNRESYQKNQGYFITKGVDIVCERGPVFNSVKLNDFVPDNLQTQILRYKTYIGIPQEYLGSQVNGIYGLVDELCAYYQGTKACFELYDFYFRYRCNGYKNAVEWAAYVQHIAGSYFAWYEFRLFTSWYLEYAKQNNHDVYESCMKNTRLRLAYTLIDNLYGQLILDFNTMLENLAAKLSNGDVKVELAEYENERSFTILTRHSPNRTSTRAYSIFSNRIKLLKALLEGKQNAILEAFRIKGANLDNYQSYL